MKEAALVRDCMEAMKKAVTIRRTVKCRLGVDDFVREFVHKVTRGGKGTITHFLIDARKAIFKGLNLAHNRSIPPLT